MKRREVLVVCSMETSGASRRYLLAFSISIGGGFTPSSVQA